MGAVQAPMENEETPLRSYQQPDAETVKRVVLHPTQRIVGLECGEGPGG